MPRLTFFVELSLIQASPPYASNLAFLATYNYLQNLVNYPFLTGKLDHRKPWRPTIRLQKKNLSLSIYIFINGKKVLTNEINLIRPFPLNHRLQQWSCPIQDRQFLPNESHVRCQGPKLSFHRPWRSASLETLRTIVGILSPSSVPPTYS